jgi:hypothetical protein
VVATGWRRVDGCLYRGLHFWTVGWMERKSRANSGQRCRGSYARMILIIFSVGSDSESKPQIRFQEWKMLDGRDG